MLLSSLELDGRTIWLGIMVLCSILLIITDVLWFWLPQQLIFVTALVNGWALYAGYSEPYWPVTMSIVLAFGLLWLRYPQGLGSGDVTLLAALALGCDGWNLYILIVAAFGSAGLVGLGAWAFSDKKMLPFGPFLLFGWWFALGWGKECLRWLGW